MARSVPRHPESLSSSELEVSGSQAVLRLRAQVLSFLEVYPELDANEDGQFDEAELVQFEPLLFDELAQNFRLARPGPEGSDLALTPQLVSLQLLEPTLELGGGYEWGALDFVLIFSSPQPIESLVLDVHLFEDTSPDHIDYLTVRWHGRDPEIVVSDHFQRRHVVPSPKPKSFLPFLRGGFRHILGGFDHLAFLAALLLTAATWRSLLWLVTGFTVAHSATLALVSTGFANTRGYESLIEAGIALSIAWVAADLAVHPDRRRTRWPEALGFGLLHGLGFAGFLRGSLLARDSVAVPLLSFNLGVELGQILVIVPLALLVGWLAPRDSDHLAPRWLRRAGGVLLAVAGLFWFFQRL